jgi:hypothetical protein
MQVTCTQRTATEKRVSDSSVPHGLLIILTLITYMLLHTFNRRALAPLMLLLESAMLSRMRYVTLHIIRCLYHLLTQYTLYDLPSHCVLTVQFSQAVVSALFGLVLIVDCATAVSCKHAH